MDYDQENEISDLKKKIYSLKKAFTLELGIFSSTFK